MEIKDGSATPCTEFTRAELSIPKPQPRVDFGLSAEDGSSAGAVKAIRANDEWVKARKQTKGESGRKATPKLQTWVPVGPPHEKHERDEKGEKLCKGEETQMMSADGEQSVLGPESTLVKPPLRRTILRTMLEVKPVLGAARGWEKLSEFKQDSKVFDLEPNPEALEDFACAPGGEEPPGEHVKRGKSDRPKVPKLVADRPYRPPLNVQDFHQVRSNVSSTAKRRETYIVNRDVCWKDDVKFLRFWDDCGADSVERFVTNKMSEKGSGNFRTRSEWISKFYRLVDRWYQRWLRNNEITMEQAIEADRLDMERFGVESEPALKYCVHLDGTLDLAMPGSNIAREEVTLFVSDDESDCHESLYVISNADVVVPYTQSEIITFGEKALNMCRHMTKTVVQTLRNAVEPAVISSKSFFNMCWDRWNVITGGSWKTCFAFAACALGVWGLVSSFSSLFTEAEEPGDVETQTWYVDQHTGERISKGARKTARRRARAEKDRASGRGGNLDDMAEQYGLAERQGDPVDPSDVSKNCIEITTPCGTSRALFVRGRVMLVNKHAFMSVDHDGKFGFVQNGELFTIKQLGKPELTARFNRECVVEMRDGLHNMDLMLYDVLPKHISGGALGFQRDVTGKFISRDLLERLSCLFQTTVVGYDHKNSCVERLESLRGSTIMEDTYTWNICDRKGIDHMVSTPFWIMTEHERAGMCGSVLTTKQHVIGIHVFARTYERSGRRIGGCIPVPQELLVLHLRMIDRLHQVSDTMCSGVKVQGLPGLAPAGACYESMGRAPVFYGSSPKTAYVDSDFCDTHFGSACKKAPAILRVTDPRYNGPETTQTGFMMSILSKGQTTCTDFPQDLMEEAIKDVVRSRRVGLHSVMNWEEVVNGGGRFPGLSGVKMSTGAGPFWSDTGLPGKHAYFTQREDQTYEIADNIHGKRLLKAFNDAEEALLNYQLPEFTSGIALKDELRSPAKISNGDSRLLMGAGIPQLLLLRKYFGALLSEFHIYNGCDEDAIGLDVMSAEWNLLFERQSRKGSHGFGGDLVRCNSNVSAQWLECYADTLEKHYFSRFPDYNKSLAHVRYLLLYELIYSNEIVGDHLFRTTGQNPTGCALTTLFNSDYTKSLLRMAFVSLAEKHKVGGEVSKGYVDYYLHIDAIVYGDDHRVAVHPNCAWFTCSAFGAWLAQYSIGYTAVVKDQPLSTVPENLLDIPFLGCSTRWCPEFQAYLPVVDAESIGKSIRYVKKSADRRKASVENANGVLRRVWGSGRKVFSAVRDSFDRRLVEMFNPDPVPPAFQLFSFRDGTLAWAGKQANCGLGPAVVQMDSTGVRFTESMPSVPTQSNVDTKFPSRRQADVDVPELQITYIELAKRPQLVATVPWGLGDVVGTSLFAGRNPWDFILGNNTGPFQQFLFYNGTLRLTFKVQATSFHSGSLIAYFVPLTPDDEIDSHISISLPSQTINQHQFLFASNSNSVTMDIPFMSIRSWLNTSTQDMDCGGFRLSVFNELVSGPNVVSGATVSIFASFPDANFKVLNPVAHPFSRFRGSASRLGPAEVQGNSVSYTRINNISEVANSTMELGGEDKFESSVSVDAKASLDKPNIGLDYPTVLVRSTPMLSNGSNVTNAHVMSIMPGGIAGPTFEEMSTSTDEMALQHVCRLSYSQTALIKDTGEPNTVLMSGAITCAPELAGASRGAVLSVPSLTYVSSRYMYWCGSINMRFQFVFPGVADARVAFVALYGHETIPSDPRLLVGQYVHYFDVTASTNVLDVCLDWRSDTPLKHVPNGADPYLFNYATGVWALIVVNPYRAPEAAPSFGFINRYVGAGDTFRLSTYGEQNLTLISEVAISEAKADGKLGLPEVQMETTPPTAVTTDLTPVDVGPPSASVRLESSEPQSIRNICRRAHLIAVFPANAVTGAIAASAPWARARLNNSASGFVTRSGLEWWANLYRIWSATPVFNFVSNADVVLTYRAVAPGPSDASNASFDFGLTTVAGAQAWHGPVDISKAASGVSVVKIPFTTINKVLLIPKKTTDLGPQYNSGHLFVNKINGALVMRVYAHLGDNSRFGCFYAVPFIKIAAVNVAPDNYL